MLIRHRFKRSNNIGTNPITSTLMPQVDIFMWFNSVIALFFVLICSYYLVSFHYLMLSLLTFKLRYKIFQSRLVIKVCLEVQKYSYVFDFKTLLLFLLCRYFYMVNLSFNSSTLIIVELWVFQQTLLKTLLEGFILGTEKLSLLSLVKKIA